VVLPNHHSQQKPKWCKSFVKKTSLRFNWNQIKFIHLSAGGLDFLLDTQVTKPFCVNPLVKRFSALVLLKPLALLSDRT
jgi:hypothetical protein